MQQINIINAKDHVDEKVKIGVWLTNKRSSGKIAFLQLRDGTAFFQGVVLKNNVSEEVFETAKELRQETSMWITGVIHEDSRLSSAEIAVESIEVLAAKTIDHTKGTRDRFLVRSPSFMVTVITSARHDGYSQRSDSGNL